MSAGAFTRSKYEANNGDVYKITVQPETLAATFGGTPNAATTAAADQGTSARVSGGNRRIGIKARSVSVAWNATPPTGYKAGDLIRIPILTEGLWDTIDLGSVGEYLGVAITVVGKQPERVR